MRPVAVIAAAALALATMAVPAGATARAPASTCLRSLPHVQQVTTDGALPLAGSTPVLFVHGINSGPGVWRPTSRSSISGHAAAIPGVTAWTFSYARQSLLWVTKQQIGPDLAHAISCLATLSGHKVVIVGHSMGGLATQYALGQDHGQVAGTTAELVTIGTPFEGSEILTIGEDVINDGLTEIDNPDVALIEALLSACAGIADHSDSNPCSLVSALRSPVGTALEAHSSAIRSLPAWPTGFPVYDTAGDMKVSMLGHDFDFGDGAGTLASAIAHNTTGSPEIVRCHESFWHLIHVDDGLCFHTSLPHNPAIIAAVLAAIRSQLAPPCSAHLLFAAAVAAEHFSTNPSQYPSDAGPGPGAYDSVCDGTWALAAISHPQLGTQDSYTLFRAKGGTWTLVTMVGGFFGDCNLERDGVPVAVAKVLWPGHSLPASDTCPPR